MPAQAPAPAVKADAEFSRRAYDTYRTMVQSSPYRNLAWQYLGPTNISGRATDIAVADSNGTRRIYAAYATSGVWKTDDDGASWQAVFENQPSTSIGDIAVAPSNPEIVWVGTGESNLFRASMPGVGVFKSIDGGRTLPARRPDRHPDHRAHRRPPDQSEHRLRGVRRARLDRERDARRVQDHRRRADVDQSALSQPADRCDRSGDGSVGSGDALRGTVGAGAAEVERPAGRAGLQPIRRLEDDRRREDLDQHSIRACPRRSSAAASVSTCRAATPTCCTPSSTATRKGVRPATASATPTAGRSRRAASAPPRSTAATTRAGRGGRSASTTTS